MKSIDKRKFWQRMSRCQPEYNTPAMQHLLNNIEAAIADPLKILKNDSASTVVVVKVDGQEVIIKRANTRHWLQALRRSISRTRAKKNWCNALHLLKIGVSTFYPIAMLEECTGPLKWRSYFVCSYIQGIDALHYFAMGAKPQKEWPQVAKNIVDLIEKLALHRISHRDLNLSNIILVDQKPWLIDLDGMRRHRFAFLAKRGAKREWQRFMQNWQEAPDLNPEVSALFQAVLHQKFNADS